MSKKLIVSVLVAVKFLSVVKWGHHVVKTFKTSAERTNWTDFVSAMEVWQYCPSWTSCLINVHHHSQC